jgi:hypothetical protein
MSEQQINIKDNVMEKIKENKISMRPKSFFVLGSILTFAGLVASFVSSIFLISVIIFLFKEHGPMGNYRFSLIINSFPLWLPVLAVIGLICGVWFLRKYDFSYKSNYILIVIVFILAIVVGGWAIDKMGLDNTWLNRGPMNGIMRQYMQNNNQQTNPSFRPGRGMNIYKNR